MLSEKLWLWIVTIQLKRINIKKLITCPLKASIINWSDWGWTHSIHFCTTWFPFWSFTHFRTCPSSSFTISFYRGIIWHYQVTQVRNRLLSPQVCISQLWFNKNSAFYIESDYYIVTSTFPSKAKQETFYICGVFFLMEYKNIVLTYNYLLVRWDRLEGFLNNTATVHLQS